MEKDRINGTEYFQNYKEKNGRIEEIKCKKDSNVGSFLLFHPI